MIKETKSSFLGITVPVTDGFGTHGQKTVHEMGFLQLQRESGCQEGTLGHRNGDTLGKTESRSTMPPLNGAQWPCDISEDPITFTCPPPSPRAEEAALKPQLVLPLLF